jgi:hypothetical protein
MTDFRFQNRRVGWNTSRSLRDFLKVARGFTHYRL